MEVRSEQVRAITPIELRADNHSLESQRLREQWYEARDDGNMLVWWLCGDARLFVPNQNALILRSIATGGDRKPYRHLLNDQGKVRGIVILNHFRGTADNSLDPSKVANGEAPEGCGGLGELQRARKNGDDPLTCSGIQHFVQTELFHPDVFIQTYTAAGETAVETDIKVLAAAQNHITGTIFPLAVFRDRGKSVESSVPMQRLFEGQYDPRRIYENGMPFLTDDSLPDVFIVAMNQNRRQVAMFRTEFPNLPLDQEVQKPHTVAFGDRLKPIQLRYPQTFGKPGTVFRISLPIQDLETEKSASFRELEAGLDQVEYPISQAVANVRNSSMPFSSVYNFLIETKNLDISARLAKDAVKRDWMRAWLQLPDRQILIAQMNHGNAERIEVFG